jgi:heme oxygenase
VNPDALQPARPPGLARLLRERTQTLHMQAERSGVMPRLLRGQLSLSGYRELLVNLQAIYAALEPALARHRDELAFGSIACETIFRSQALGDDLRDLAQVDQVAAHSASASAGLAALRPATVAYVERLRQLDADAPILLAAHAYVRFLGDLSGGQALARIVARCYGLSEGRGTAFYDFGDAATVGVKASHLRAALDALDLDAATVTALAEEACDAFRRHSALFEELASTG